MWKIQGWNDFFHFRDEVLIHSRRHDLWPKNQVDQSSKIYANDFQTNFAENLNQDWLNPEVGLGKGEIMDRLK